MLSYAVTRTTDMHAAGPSGPAGINGLRLGFGTTVNAARSRRGNWPDSEPGETWCAGPGGNPTLPVPASRHLHTLVLRPWPHGIAGRLRSQMWPPMGNVIRMDDVGRFAPGENAQEFSLEQWATLRRAAYRQTAAVPRAAA